MVRVTRNEAAARLKVSKSTLDRMIKRGELTTETEQHGHRHTVWVLMDDDIEDTAEVSTGNINGHFPEASEHTKDDTGRREPRPPGRGQRAYASWWTCTAKG